MRFGLSAVALVVLLPFAAPTQSSTLAHSDYLYPGEDGKLVYAENDRGDHIPDFSNCGYMGGGVALPEVPARIVVEPGSVDRERIQSAIDMVAGLPPDESGFRGAVVLEPGRYMIDDTINITAGGIVLRGSGNGEDGTVLVATKRKQHTLISIRGEGSWDEIEGTRHQITDEYVPVGARSFHVDSTEGLQVGDAVIVHRPSTAEWIHELGMDQIPPRKDGRKVYQWKPGSRELDFDRVITAIDDTKITIDAPVVNSLSQQYGGGSIYAYECPGRIENVGIENLRCVSEFDASKTAQRRGETYYSDEEHAWNCVHMQRVKNAWVRDVIAVHFGYSAVYVARRAKWITVQDCQYIDPVSIITGSRRYSFALKGQLTLVQRCYTENGRHDFVMHSVVSGPNVFLDCTARDAHSDSGPHHRWATGTLYDNVTV
ncbi:MAG: hypothetical protein ACLFWB_08975, partial [Armatimonadota bacterium]